MNTLLITGASGAIGSAAARALAASGSSLYLHYYSSKEKAEELQQELRERFPNQAFLLVCADLSDEKGPECLMAQLDQPIDGVVYASGNSEINLFQDVANEVIKQTIQLQLTSPFRLLQQLIKPMIHNKRGQILMVSSIWGLEGAATEVLYSMVKGGQNAFVKALAKEAAPSGISVNAVAPGAVDTPMMDVFSEEDLKRVEDEIPMGRMAKPQEVASLINFLMSPSAEYINGQIISINGAWYC
ncbi:elongation factor P 5-aminopentanone reductase [Sporolactobacillus terrae]|nr:SDR family oxidoreductase [Sporolactobacillus terrae]QAA22397.1 KR domain-containing protein [Sporolactobacillus terrae]QAA26980.1 KR domain-containing protein [Sporolactobacillus terrae]UAK17182.1 SDR family oxidoreductase [Sporolactobacillus terrae]